MTAEETTRVTDPTARELLDLLERREVSARDVIDAHIARIEALDPTLNAIPTRSFERAREEARVSDARRARKEPLPPLEGLPVAFKDLQPTAGIRTTMGSRVLADWIPDQDSLTVRRIRSAGAIGLGKTNVPEFGAGSQTYNQVFGPTRNPWDLTRTPGGSSGGAAAALAARMVALADGSDYGGSLRNPASFCNVVGFRTTPGLIPDDEPGDGLSLSVDGPMARTVRDVALFLSVLAAPATFAVPEDVGVRGRRIALAPRFAGLPMDPDVTAEVEAAGARLERLGCVVELAEPDVHEAELAFLAPRHVSFRRSVLETVGDRVDELKPELRWHVTEGATVTGDELEAAARAKRRLIDGFTRFMQRFDALVLPVSQVLPFPVDVTWPREIEGVAMPNYVEWMRSCWAVSLFGGPALAVPSGFGGRDGHLPIGIQLVGRPGDEQAILELGAAYEQAAGEPWRIAPYALRS
jgi:amidase